MANINIKLESKSNSKQRIFLFVLVLILAIGRTWGLIDEYLIGRFFLLSLLAIWAIFFILPTKAVFKIVWLDILFLGFYILSLVSLTWAIVPAAGFISVQTIGLSFVYYILFRILYPAFGDKFILNALLIGVVLSLAVVFYQLIELGLKSGIGGDHIYKIAGWAGHKNLVASFQFLLFGLLLYYIFTCRPKYWVYYFLILQLALILVLRTRAVYLAVASFGVILILYFLFANKTYFASSKKRILSIIAGSFLFGGLLFFSLGGQVSDIQKLNPTKYLNSTTGAERRFVWYKTRQLINDQWLTGYGAGNWKLVFPSKNIDGSWRLQTQNVLFTRAHNDYLEIWAETGIIGLMIFLSIFILAMKYAWQHFKQTDIANKHLALTLFGLILGYMIIAFFDFPKERMEHQILLAFIFTVVVNHYEKAGVLDASLFTINKFSLMKGLFFVILCINLIIGYYTIKGEFYNRKAMLAQSAGNWKSMENDSKKAYSNIYKINPVATSVKWFQGLALYQQGKFIEAEIPLALASKHTPYHFNSLNDYASCLVQLKKYKEAIEIYQKVLFINPKFEDAMFNLSYAYSQVGEYEKALDWLRKTKTLPLKKENFIREIEKLNRKD